MKAADHDVGSAPVKLRKTIEDVENPVVSAPREENAPPLLFDDEIFLVREIVGRDDPRRALYGQRPVAARPKTSTASPREEGDPLPERRLADNLPRVRKPPERRVGADIPLPVRQLRERPALIIDRRVAKTRPKLNRASRMVVVSVTERERLDAPQIEPEPLRVAPRRPALTRVREPDVPPAPLNPERKPMLDFQLRADAPLRRILDQRDYLHTLPSPLTYESLSRRSITSIIRLDCQEIKFRGVNKDPRLTISRYN